MNNSLVATNKKSENARPEKITELTHQLQQSMQASLGEINNINTKTKLLSFNAQIQAAKAGAAGTSFAVVAAEMNNLSAMTSDVSQTLVEETQGLLAELENISHRLSFDVRGKRLSDICLTNIDLIDRNLYERTCDVRWWATDTAVVKALEEGTSDAQAYASRRLGVILDAYTVYFDLVLCDLKGRVIANGRPDQYNSKGSTVRNEAWFKQAIASLSGDEFGFQSVHKSELVQDEHILAYSCGVRRDGDAQGELLGVLGIFFKWESLAQTIMKTCPIPSGLEGKIRVMILNEEGLVLADSEEKLLEETLPVSNWKDIFSQKSGFYKKSYKGADVIIAHALAPGFETYSTGWHSLIIQNLDD